MSQLSVPAWRIPVSSLDGVRRRRMFGVMLDFVIVCAIVLTLSLGLAVVTLGLSLFFLPSLFPLVAFFYNGLSISGRGRGTPGMRANGLYACMEASGAPVPFINAAAHGVLFYVSWLFPPVLLVSLFAADKRCLHDFFSGIIVLRR